MPHGAIPFPFGQCRICNDKATGVHYGVATCEGCKGFYKRSIPKGEKYRCYFGGTCVITPENRNRCKSCRFRKCLEQGMAMEAVKMGRIPKVEKERALEEVATFKKDGGDGSCMSPPNTAAQALPTPKQTTANGNAAKRPACSSLPFDGDLGCAPWDLPHGDSVQNGHRYPHPHKKFITEFPVKEDGIKVEASDCFFPDKSFHLPQHPHPMPLGQPKGQFNDVQTGPTGLALPDRSAMNSQVPYSLQSQNNTGHHHNLTEQGMDGQRMYQSENGFADGTNNKDMFRVDSGVFMSHSNASFSSGFSSNNSLYEHDASRFSMPRDATFNVTGSRSSSVNSNDTSSGFSSHSSFSPEEGSMSLDWYKKDPVSHREENDLGPFEKLMIASEAARNQNQECQNNQAAGENKDSHQDFIMEDRAFGGMSGEMGGSQLASPGASPPLSRPAGATPNNSGKSSPENGSRGQRNSYSPGLIKVLFHQVMKGDNGEQRDKLLKKLARTCSQEALGSSGLELLHSVVNSNMACSRDPHKTASSPDIRANLIQGASSHASSCSSIAATAGSTPSLACSSPALSQNSYPMPSYGSDSQLNLNSLDGGSSLFPPQHALGSSGRGGMLAPMDRNSMDCRQSWSQSPPYPQRGQQGSHPLQQPQCQPQSDALTQSQNQSFFKEFFPSSQSFPTANMGPFSSDGQHPSSQHSPPLGFTQSHPQQAFGESMENGTILHMADHFTSVDNHLGVPPADNTACEFDLNYLCQEQLRDIHESQNLSDSNSPASSHEGSQVNLAAANGDHNLKDYATPSQLIEGQIKNGMTQVSFDSLQGKETLTSACYDSLGAKLTGTPAYFSDAQMKEAAMVLGSGIFRIFESATRRAHRDRHLKIMREDPTVKMPPTVNHYTEIYPLIMKTLPEVNQRIINFCQLAPGFAKLDATDQKTLLKRAYYDIWMLTSSEYFVDGESYLVVAPDPIFYVRRDMEKIIGAENTKTIHCFAQQFNALSLSDLEVAILCCIQLTAPGHDQEADLKDVKEIQKLNSFYLDLLVAVVTDIHADSCSRVLIDIFRLVPLLTEINRLQRELIGNFSIKNPPQCDQNQEETQESA